MAYFILTAQYRDHWKFLANPAMKTVWYDFYIVLFWRTLALTHTTNTHLASPSAPGPHSSILTLRPLARSVPNKTEGTRHGANIVTGPNTSLFKRNPSELYSRHSLGVLVLLLLWVQFKLFFGDVTSFGPASLHYHITWLFPPVVVPFGKFLAAGFLFSPAVRSSAGPVPSLAACVRATGNSNPVRKSAKWSSVRCVALDLIWLTWNLRVDPSVKMMS